MNTQKIVIKVVSFHITAMMAYSILQSAQHGKSRSELRHLFESLKTGGSMLLSPGPGLPSCTLRYNKESASWMILGVGNTTDAYRKYEAQKED